MNMSLPVVVNTWAFNVATDKAWETLCEKKLSAVDAIEAGCGECERKQCDFTVGFGGSPDESGETTLDAMIMDGPTHNMGAVGALRGIKNAIGVARKVMENTKHSFLVGSQASAFAKSMGFVEETLSTNYSTQLWKDWKSNKCQPNFWQNVSPDPSKSCGPYHLVSRDGVVDPESSAEFAKHRYSLFGGPGNHDTVGMIAIDDKGRIAVGTSSNGAKFKIPGRVGDSPVAGAGAYVDQDVGGAAATGDGDIMMRLLPSYQIVENMRLGMSPDDAAGDAMARIIRKFPAFSGGLVAVTKDGQYGAACHGIETFPYSVRNTQLGKTTTFTVKCI